MLSTMSLPNNTPYTYFIQWTKTGAKYYGVRYANDCHPDEFWKRYFTTSIYVDEYRKIHGEPDVIEIRKRFNDDDRVNRSRLWEHRVLKKLKVIRRSDYLNKSDSKSIDPLASSKARTGVAPGNKGLPQSEEIKQKKRKPKPIVTCPVCGVSGGVSAMYRHHFNMCDQGVATKTINKLKSANQKKSARPIVAEIRALKNSMPNPRKVNQLIGLKPGWYQLSDEQLNSYLSSLKVLNLGNLSE